MKKQEINFHYITDNNFFGYGMATKNMMESFKLLNNYDVINVKPGERSRISSTDFYLRVPPWQSNRSKKKIAYFYWETDKLPVPWARVLNTADEIWAPCELVKDVCVRAGFFKKIHIVPTPHKDWDINVSATISDARIGSQTFKFYSVFQWHTRKGWKELLKSYWSAFSRSDDVVLILKVNSVHGEHQNHLIRSEIESYKAQLGLSETPKIFLIDSFLSSENLYALHEYCDCYISPHHGEGWGMPIHNAIYAQKNIITTKYGGVTDYLDDTNANLIEFSMGPVKDMSWNAAYEPGQNWANPSVDHTIHLMRDIFQNRSDQRFLNKRASLKNISKITSIDAVSKKISSLL
jgi:hypothetical protein